MAIKLGDAVLDIKGDPSELEKGFAGVGKKIAAGMAIVGTAIVASLGAAVVKANEFSKGIGNIATLGVPNLNELKAGIMEVAQAIGVDLGDAAQATYDIISAGIEPAKAIEFLGAAAIAAKAGIGELSDAVDLGTTIMNAFGLTTADTGKIFDQTQKAIKLGKTNIAELGAAVGKVAPLLKGAGVASEEMFAALAQLTGGGIKTAEAVTGLRAVLNAILKPTAEAEKLAKKLEIGWDSNALATKGLSEIMTELSEATKGNVDQIGILIPSVEAMPIALRLMADGGAQLADKLDQVTNSTGESLNAFERYREANPAEKFDRLKAVVEVLAIKIGDILVPVLGQLVDKFMPILVSISDWITENPKWSAAIVLIAGSLGLIFIALGTILFLMPGIIASMTLLSGKLLAVGGSSNVAAAGLTKVGISGTAAGAGAAKAGIGLKAMAVGAAASAAALAAWGVLLAAGAFLLFGIGIAISETIDAFQELAEKEKQTAELRERLLREGGKTEEEINERSNQIANEKLARIKTELAAELGRAATTEEVRARMIAAEGKLALAEMETQRVSVAKSTAIVKGLEEETAAGMVRIGEIVVNGKTFIATITKERQAAIEAENVKVIAWKNAVRQRNSTASEIIGVTRQLTKESEDAGVDAAAVWDKLSKATRQSLSEIVGDTKAGTDAIGQSWNQLTPELQGEFDKIIRSMMQTSPFATRSPSLVQQTQRGLEVMASSWEQFNGFLNGILEGLWAKIQQISPFFKSSPSLVEQTQTGTVKMIQSWRRFHAFLTAADDNLARRRRNNALELERITGKTVEIATVTWRTFFTSLSLMNANAAREQRNLLAETKANLSPVLDIMSNLARLQAELRESTSAGDDGVPGAATGATVRSGGIIDIHRNERVFLPTAAKIIPLSPSERAMGRSGGRGDINLNISMPGMVIRETADIDRLSERMFSKVDRSLRRVGIQTGLATAG